MFQSSIMSWSSKTIDARHDRQQPALPRRRPRLVVQPRELLELVDQLGRQVHRGGRRRPAAGRCARGPWATSRRRTPGRRARPSGPATTRPGGWRGGGRGRGTRRRRGRARRAPAAASTAARAARRSGTSRTARAAGRRCRVGGPCGRCSAAGRATGRASGPRRRGGRRTRGTRPAGARARRRARSGARRRGTSGVSWPSTATVQGASVSTQNVADVSATWRSSGPRISSGTGRVAARLAAVGAVVTAGIYVLAATWRRCCRVWATSAAVTRVTAGPWCR